MKDPKDMTEEELCEEIRHQVNLSRNSSQGHDREFTRRLSAELNDRGWGIGPAKQKGAADE